MTYIAGGSFGIADITALCTADFARTVKLEPNENQVHLRRWHWLVSSRSGAKA